MSSRESKPGPPCSLSVASLRALLAFSLCCLISGTSDRENLATLNQIMSEFPVIDGHNDLALRLRIHYHNNLSQINLINISRVATDIFRLKKGHVQAQLFAAYVMCGAQEKDAVRLTLEQIDVIRRMCTESDDFLLVTSSQEIIENEKSGKIACLITIEGGHSIDSSLPALRMFYQLGVRSMSLTHSCNTPWAKSSSRDHDVSQRKNDSLTDFGKAVVTEMNRLGMIVDLSHTSLDTAAAALRHSVAPVIFSHSSSDSVCKHHRNVPDWLLLELKTKDGLIMVNFYNKFVSCKSQATISDLADHFDHIKNLIGAQYIGIGADFDGAESFPQDLENVSKYPVIIQELIRRNWTKNELGDVLRRNFLRVFKKVEEVRENLKSMTPSEDSIPPTELKNPCRMVLEPPVVRTLSSHRNASFRAAGSLFQCVILLLLSSLFWVD